MPAGPRSIFEPIDRDDAVADRARRPRRRPVCVDHRAAPDDDRADLPVRPPAQAAKIDPRAEQQVQHGHADGDAVGHLVG